ncbi:MAG: succinate dehydrogenase flavoprotein subunit, partial [Actinomycetota bacterium]
DVVRTAVISKLYPTRSHTGTAQGGMCAALGNVEEDSAEWHTFDTVKGGDYLVDQPAADIMCREAVDAVIELEHWGFPFNRTPEGKIDQRRFGGHTRNHGEAPVRRACYAADRTGHMILQTLYQQCIKRNVRFFNEFYVLDLLLTGGRVAGVVAYELATGELHVFRTKSVLFATGGYGRVFMITSNAHALTGDGPAVVWRRGIPLEDMEFFQFHPTGIYKLGILVSEAVRGEGGILLNSEGERFMERYAPTVKDLAPRDVVSRAIYQEITEGRGVGPRRDAVYVDVRHLPRTVIEEKLPDVTEFARVYLGVEPTTEPVPIQPTAHYAMGGIPTNADAQVVVGPEETPVPGLYAAGECACVSVHGANRLGTNSLLDIVVFGRRGGRHMAQFAAEADFPEPPSRPETSIVEMLRGLLRGPHIEFVADIRAELQRHMFDLCGVVRSEEGLCKLQGILAGLRERFGLVGVQDQGRVFNTELMEAVELGFLLDVSDAVVAAALARDESRGGHY